MNAGGWGDYPGDGWGRPDDVRRELRGQGRVVVLALVTLLAAAAAVAGVLVGWGLTHG